MDPTTYTIQEDYKTTITENSYEIIFMGDTNDKKMNLWTAENKQGKKISPPVTQQTADEEAKETNIEAYNKVAPTDAERSQEEEEAALQELNSELLFKPLKALGINTNVSSKAKKPPRTCCVGRRNVRGYKPETYVKIPIKDSKTDVSKDTDDRIGDYILISTNLTYEENKNNVIPTFPTNAELFPTSDHLPVVSVILLPKASEQDSAQPSEQAGGNRRHRRKHKSARQLHTRNRHKHKQTKLKNTKTKRIYKK